MCRYPEFAPMFKAELWDPDEWANIFKSAGAKCELELTHFPPNPLLYTPCTAQADVHVHDEKSLGIYFREFV